MTTYASATLITVALLLGAWAESYWPNHLQINGSESAPSGVLASTIPPARSVSGVCMLDSACGGPLGTGSGSLGSAAPAPYANTVGRKRDGNAPVVGLQCSTARGNTGEDGESHERAGEPICNARDLASTDRVQVVPYERWAMLSQAANAAGVELTYELTRRLYCESGWNPRAVATEGDQAYLGLAQIWLGHVGDREVRALGAVSHEALLDPVVNLRVAHFIEQRDGLGAWPVTRYGCKEFQ